jgi:hypothetical protein
MAFWDKATQEQRLAQIDGGIECGMTSKQIATCLGAPIYIDGKSNAVNDFGNYHGRQFPTTARGIGLKAWKSAERRISEKARRIRGEPEITDPTAFSIFNTPQDPNPFASLKEELDA